jgi:prepilin-type N-terminal cleavage/methylation domain-containing protein
MQARIRVMRKVDRIRPRGRGFTMVELLVVIGVLALLMAILIPVIFGAAGAGVRTESQNNLRQIGQWMGQYSTANREFIVPSQFDYSANSYPGQVRDNAGNVGTWSDIIWTQYVKQTFPEAITPLGHDYGHDSPDNALHDLIPDVNDPLRSAEENQMGGLKARLGFFAANQFFNADPNSPTFNNWWRLGQIAEPAKSLYLIDSFAGETIEDDPNYWGVNELNWQVDYRYAGDALILFIDGHTGSLGEVKQPYTLPATNDLEEIELIRKIRITNLDRR